MWSFIFGEEGDNDAINGKISHLESLDNDSIEHNEEEQDPMQLVLQRLNKILEKSAALEFEKKNIEKENDLLKKKHEIDIKRLKTNIDELQQQNATLTYALKEIEETGIEMKFQEKIDDLTDMKDALLGVKSELEKEVEEKDALVQEKIKLAESKDQKITEINKLLQEKEIEIANQTQDLFDKNEIINLKEKNIQDLIKASKSSKKIAENFSLSKQLIDSSWKDHAISTLTKQVTQGDKDLLQAQEKNIEFIHILKQTGSDLNDLQDLKLKLKQSYDQNTGLNQTIENLKNKYKNLNDSLQEEMKKLKDENKRLYENQTEISTLQQEKHELIERNKQLNESLTQQSKMKEDLRKLQDQNAQFQNCINDQLLMKQEIDSLMNENESLKKATNNQKMDKKIISELKDSISELQALVFQYESERKAKNDATIQLKSDMENLQQELSLLQDKNIENQNQLQNYNIMSSNINELKMQLSNYESHINELEGKVFYLEQENIVNKNLCIEKDNQITSLNEQYAYLEVDYSNMLSKFSTAEIKIESLIQSVSEGSSEVGSLKDQLFHVQKELKETCNINKQLQEKLQVSQTQLEQVQNNLQDAHKQTEILEQKDKQLVEKTAQLVDKEEQYQVLNEVYQELIQQNEFLSHEKKRFEEELNQLEMNKQAILSVNDKKMKEMQDEMDRLVFNLNEEKQMKEESISNSKKEISESLKHIENLTIELNTLKKLLNESEKREEQYRSQIQQNKTKYQSLQDESLIILKQKKEEVYQFKNMITHYQDQMNILDKEMSEVKAQNSALEFRCHRLVDQLSLYVESPQDTEDPLSSEAPNLWNLLLDGMEEIKLGLAKEHQLSQERLLNHNL